MNAPSNRRGRRRARRTPAGGRNSKLVVSEFPKFLVRLARWRKGWLSRTEPKPGFRHD